MELTRLLSHSSHKCVESYGPQHRMCLFRRVCRRDVIPTENDKGHRTFDYYLPKPKPHLESSFRTNGIMRSRERRITQPVRLWARSLDTREANAAMDPSIRYEEAPFTPDENSLIYEPVVLIHAFVPENHGHQLLESLLPIYELLQNLWPSLLQEDGTAAFRVAVVSPNDITHPDRTKIPLEPKMALFQWIELLTGKPLLFLDEFPGKACFRHLLMGTGFRGFLGD